MSWPFSSTPATWFLPSVPGVDGYEPSIARWRYGTITVRSGKIHSVQARWWPRWGSVYGAMMDRVVRQLPLDECRFYYAFPLRSPGFLSLLYVHAGDKTSYRTFHQGIVAMDCIARIRGAQAIVCEVTNDRLTESMMARWGYVPHARSLGDHHYIRRFHAQSGLAPKAPLPPGS